MNKRIASLLMVTVMCLPYVCNAQETATASEFEVAVRNNDAKKVNKLLKGGADANATALNGIPLLRVAAKDGYAKIVKYLINAGADVAKKSGKNKETAAHQAARFGRKTALAHLIKKDKKLVNMETFKRVTALHLAAKNGHTSCVELLLKKGAKKNKQDLNYNKPGDYARKNYEKAKKMMELLGEPLEITEAAEAEAAS